MRKIMMMVFLAEGNSAARIRLSEGLDWEKSGFEFIGFASDGEEAYEKILKEKPDILFADADLERIDGFELGRRAKSVFPEIRIVIIGRQNKIEDMRLAMRLGVSDYLLAPVSKTDLISCLARIRTVPETGQKNYQALMQKDQYKETALKKQNFLNVLVTHSMPLEELKSRASDLDIEFGQGVYRFMIFKVWRADCGEYDDEDLVQINRELEIIIKSVFGCNCLFCRNGNEQWTIVMFTYSEENMQDKTSILKKLIKEMMTGHSLFDYFGGAGYYTVNTEDLRDAFHSAEKVFLRRFAVNSDKIIFAEDIKQSENEVFTKDNFDKLEQSRLMIERFLIKGNPGEINDFINLYFAQIPEENFRSLLLMQWLR